MRAAATAPVTASPTTANARVTSATVRAVAAVVRVLEHRDHDRLPNPCSGRGENGDETGHPGQGIAAYRHQHGSVRGARQPAEQDVGHEPVAGPSG